MSRSRQITYSQALTELERIIAEIESEETDVDTVAEKVKRAAQLITFCRSRLKETGEEVKKVLAGMEEKTEAGDTSVKDLGLD
jgi:exodeoxyribonuclease VII small subunit